MPNHRQHTVTRRNQVGTTPAARKSARIHRAAAERETHGELLAAHVDNVRSKVRAAPLEWWRQWWRHHDVTAAGTGFVAAYLAAFVLYAADAITPLPVGPFRAVLHVFPLWITAILVAIGYGAWTYNAQHAKRARERWLEDEGAPVRELFRPRYTTIDIEQLPHRRTDYGRTPTGYSVEQYQAQHPVIRDSLGHHVTIRLARPGVVAITQLYRDLLAQPVPWRDVTDPDPERIWLGINWDAHDVHAPLSRDGQGLAWFMIGAPGSGKSAEINAILAQVCALPIRHRRLWIIDPADGVDLGCWHPFANRIARTPREGLQLLRDLVAEMEDTRRRMAAAGIDKCHPSDAFPWDLLAIDELPELTLNEDRKLAAEACELLARIRRLGRKTNTSIVAITQDASREVVPKTISKIFSHRLAFKVSTPTEADIALPGARVKGYDCHAFDPDHAGRFYLWNLREYVEVRGCGLYGAKRHEVVHALSATRPSDVRPLNGHHPATVALDRPPWPPPTNNNAIETVSRLQPSNGTSPNGTAPPKRRTAAQLRVELADRGQRAGRLGLNAKMVAEELGEPDWRVRRALNDLGYVKARGSFIAPEAAR